MAPYDTRAGVGVLCARAPPFRCCWWLLVDIQPSHANIPTVSVMITASRFCSLDGLQPVVQVWGNAYVSKKAGHDLARFQN